MRIALVSPLYESVPPRLYGGTERVIYNLAEDLVDLGQDVTLFASGDSNTRAKLVAVVDRSLRLDPNSQDFIAPHVLMVEKVFQERNNFDLIHFHIDHFQLPLIRRYGIVALSTFHGRLDVPDIVQLYSEFRDLSFSSISNSQRTPLSWLKWQGTVYHGLKKDVFRPTFVPGNYLAFLGRISPEKGVEDAIEIARGSGMKLKIAAKVDDADKDYFESKIQPLLRHAEVEYIGEITEPEKNEFLGNAYATLFPVRWPEPFGLVMIESMACGTPVIAFRNGSVPEVMSDRSGYIVNSVAEAVRAVERLRTFDRSGCRQYFEERFLSTRMTREYLEIYERLIDHATETAA